VIESQDERTSCGVANPGSVWDGVPFVGGEGGYGSSELGPDQRERVLNIPTLFMEGSSLEPVFRPSIEKFHLDGIVQGFS
jgi:hypothetical protein